jgi:hypothetical protein
MTLRYILAVFILVWTGSAAMAGDTVREADLVRIKTLSVVSAISEEIRFAKTGEFARGFFVYPIADWDLNQTVYDEVKGFLGSRFAVKRVADLPGYFSEPLPLFGMPDTVVARLRALPADPNTDAYLVITEILKDDYIQRRPIHGLEVLHMSTIFTSATQEYCGYAVALVDAHTFETLAWREHALMPPGRGFHASDIWADSVAELTAERRQTIRSEFTKLMTGTLEQTLREMKIIH